MDEERYPVIFLTRSEIVEMTRNIRNSRRERRRISRENQFHPYNDHGTGSGTGRGHEHDPISITEDLRSNFIIDDNETQSFANNEIEIIHEEANELAPAEDTAAEAEAAEEEAEMQEIAFEEYRVASIQNTKISQEEVSRIMKKYPVTNAYVLEGYHPNIADTCGICLETFGNSSRRSLMTRCGHCFHPRCFRKNLMYRRECAQCRKNVDI